MFVRIRNREDPDQTASEEEPDLGLRSLSRAFLAGVQRLKFKNIYHTVSNWGAQLKRD